MIVRKPSLWEKLAFWRKGAAWVGVEHGSGPMNHEQEQVLAEVKQLVIERTKPGDRIGIEISARPSELSAQKRSTTQARAELLEWIKKKCILSEFFSNLAEYAKEQGRIVVPLASQRIHSLASEADEEVARLESLEATTASEKESLEKEIEKAIFNSFYLDDLHGKKMALNARKKGLQMIVSGCGHEKDFSSVVPLRERWVVIAQGTDYRSYRRDIRLFSRYVKKIREERRNAKRSRK